MDCSALDLFTRMEAGLKQRIPAAELDLISQHLQAFDFDLALVGVWGAMEPKTNVRVYHRRSVPSSHAFASTLQLHKSASRFISDRS